MTYRSKLCTAIPLTLLAACGGGGSGGGNPPSALQYSDSFTVFMVDEAHAALVPTVHGLVTDWSIEPALPSGLELDPLTGEISGTPHASAARQVYTVEASNGAGATQALVEFSVERPVRYAYVTNSDDPTISILAIDSGSGSVTRRGFVAAQAGEANPEGFVPSPTQPYGFSTTADGKLSTWVVDESSGWLTELDSLDIDLGAHAVAVAPDGRFVLVANRDAAGVSVYSAVAGNGLLEQVGPDVGVASQPVSIAFDFSGTRVAVASAGDFGTGIGSMLTLFSFDPEAGLLAPQGFLLLNSAQPAGCAFAVRQNVIYVALPLTERVLSVEFDPSNGEMVSLGSAYSGAGCGALALDPLGVHVWASNRVDDTLACFEVQSNGSLVPASTVPLGNAPVALAIDPLGRYLFALNRDGQTLGLLDLEEQEGAAVPLADWTTRTRPTHLSFGRGEHALTAASSRLLAANCGSNDVRTHPVDTTTGAVGAGTAVPTGAGPLSVTIDPRQRFAFTGNSVEHSISSFRIDPQTGALTEVEPRLQTQGIPLCVAADASGRFLYAGLAGLTPGSDGFVKTYAIDSATGALTEIGSSTSGLAPRWLGINPTGQFLYVANNGDGTEGTATIAIFRLAPVTGLPTGDAELVPTPGVWSIGFHPDGQCLYAALRDTNSTVPFQISQADGSLSAIDGGVGTDDQPVSVTLTPDGRWAYIAYQNIGGSGTIGLYEVDPLSGALVPPASPFLDGIEPLDLRIDVTGKFLYTANSGTDTISVFSLQSSDGFLQPLAPAPTGLVPCSLALLQHWQ